MAGKCNGKLDRWIEGEPEKRVLGHIFILIIGYPPFRPSKWVYAEPTIASAKLGWDIVQAKNGKTPMLPELSGDGDTMVEDQQRSLTSRIKEGLHPKTLLPTILISAVTSVLVAELAIFFRAKIREIRKRNS